MRLTLRTLLAYMDDILDPSDQEELGRKIEASPFATELIHRSRDAVRRLRLSAPEPLAADSDDLHASDHNLDANMAAEYLDNTLSPDAVAEFERNCLEAGPHADMLLAEAASCHHILTLVLGEPAEVDGDLRQRMYEIGKQAAPQQLRIEPAHHTPEPEQAELTPSPVFGRPAVDPDEAAVPDYMLEAARARRRKNHQLYAMMFLAAALGGVAAFFLWPQREAKLPDAVAAMGNVDDITSGIEVGGGEAADTGAGAETASADGGGVAAPFNPNAVATPGPNNGDATTAVEPTRPVGPAPQADAAAGAATGDQAATNDATSSGPDLGSAGDAADAGLPAPTGTTPPAVGQTTPEIPGDVAPGAAPSDVAGSPVDVGTPPDATEPATEGAISSIPPAIPTPPIPVPPAPPSESAATPGSESGAMAPDATAAPGVNPANGTGESAAGAAAPDAGAVAADSAPAGFGENEATPPAGADNQPRTLGTYLGLNNDLLLRFDRGAKDWLRVPPRSTLTAGDRLLVLPSFRTLAVLGADINAYLGGGTEIALLAPGGGATGDVALAFPYGRLILNAGLKGNTISLAMGDLTRTITLGPSSSLAVEVRRTFVPGNDPAKDPALLEVSWYLTTGKADWNDGSADHSAQGPATWTTTAGVDQAPQAIADLPNWIDKEPITNIEAGARDAVAETLRAGESAAAPLLELTSSVGLGRRAEVRALAARSAAYVGAFEPLVKALADPAERARRKEQVETLRAAISRDPAAIEQIHNAFDLQFGDEAATDLTEMLVGYNKASIGTTRDEVKNGMLNRLINWLADDNLAYRVLASHNINEITGTLYLGGYRPEHAAAARQREMRYYWDRLEKGELMPVDHAAGAPGARPTP